MACYWTGDKPYLSQWWTHSRMHICIFQTCIYLENKPSMPSQYTEPKLGHHSACRGPYYWRGLTLIPAWISNYMPGKVWGEITYPFLNFNVNHWSWGMGKSFHPTLYNVCNYLSMLGLKLNHVGKRGLICPSYKVIITTIINFLRFHSPCRLPNNSNKMSISNCHLFFITWAESQDSIPGASYNDCTRTLWRHYIIIMASEIISSSTVHSTASSGIQQGKHQSSAWLALWERNPLVNSPTKGQGYCAI